MREKLTPVCQLMQGCATDDFCDVDGFDGAKGTDSAGILTRLEEPGIIHRDWLASYR